MDGSYQFLGLPTDDGEGDIDFTIKVSLGSNGVVVDPDSTLDGITVVTLETASSLAEFVDFGFRQDAEYGDSPLPYPTTIDEGGPVHSPTGPTLGVNRDAESDGNHSTGSDFDDLTGTVDDEDGVTFGIIHVGALDAKVTINVQGSPAKLDAWIDFNGDGSWGGPFEQIADAKDVFVGDNLIEFDVPSWAQAGTAYARFRLSTAGDLGVGGFAADGEVEDHAVEILRSNPGTRAFSSARTISDTAIANYEISTADVDNDGDLDVLSASRVADKIAWHENDGNGGFLEHVIATGVDGPRSVAAIDMDGDGDIDLVASSFEQGSTTSVSWYENNGSQYFSERVISTSISGPEAIYPADIDGDGDIDVVAALNFDSKVVWV